MLTAFLRQQDLTIALAYCHQMAIGSVETSGDSTNTKLHPFLTFTPGSQGGMIVLNTGGCQVDWEVTAKEIVQLLKIVNRDDLSAEFFISMLKVSMLLLLKVNKSTKTP